MRNVEGKPKMRALTAPLSCKMWNELDEEIPFDFEWDGSSVPVIAQGIFPRHRHPIASCKHDFRCKKAKNKEERLWSDKKFKQDVAKTSWKVTAWLGYAGVRIGALFGVGSKF
jgi:hypothetical protein